MKSFFETIFGDDHDEEGKEGKWTKPQNPGGSVWLTNKKQMCRVVRTDGMYMDLPKKQLNRETIQQYLNTPHFKIREHDLCKRKRVMIHRADMSVLRLINVKAASCIYQDVRGNVIFCERDFVPDL